MYQLSQLLRNFWEGASGEATMAQPFRLTPFCSEQPHALAADTSLSLACSVSLAISSREVYVLKVNLGAGRPVGL